MSLQPVVVVMVMMTVLKLHSDARLNSAVSAVREAGLGVAAAAQGIQPLVHATCGLAKQLATSKPAHLFLTPALPSDSVQLPVSSLVLLPW